MYHPSPRNDDRSNFRHALFSCYFRAHWRGCYAEFGCFFQIAVRMGPEPLMILVPYAGAVSTGEMANGRTFNLTSLWAWFLIPNTASRTCLRLVCIYEQLFNSFLLLHQLSQGCFRTLSGNLFLFFSDTHHFVSLLVSVWASYLVDPLATMPIASARPQHASILRMTS